MEHSLNALKMEDDLDYFLTMTTSMSLKMKEDLKQIMQQAF